MQLLHRNGRTVTCGGMRIIQKISSTGFVIFNVNNAQEWTDSNMRWDEAEYGGVKDIRVPPSSLWKPDILMYNRSSLLSSWSPSWLCHQIIIRHVQKRNVKDHKKTSAQAKLLTEPFPQMWSSPLMEPAPIFHLASLRWFLQLKKSSRSSSCS